MKKIVWLSVCVMFLFGCVSFNLGNPGRITADTKTYSGIGEDQSMLTALNNAKMSAVRKGIVELIGAYNEQQYAETLQKNLYQTNNPNAFIENDNLVVKQKHKTGDDYFFEIEVSVKMTVLSQFLTANNIPLKETNLPQLPANVTVPQTSIKTPDATLKDARQKADEAGHAQFIDEHINHSTYVVYAADSSTAQEFQLKSAVQMANSYLLSKGYSVVDYAEVEKLKRDSATVYEEITGEGISAMQWIAQKFNADIYLELEGMTEGGENQDGYYGSAKITAKLFSPSTGELLASLPYSSQITYSTISRYDAENNALLSVTYKVLPLAESQAKILLAKEYGNGLRYDITINGVNDTKAMLEFKTKLSQLVESVKTKHLTGGSAQFIVYSFSDIDEVIDAVYDVAASIPSLQDIDMVMQRGKTVTFAK